MCDAVELVESVESGEDIDKLYDGRKAETHGRYIGGAMKDVRDLVGVEVQGWLLTRVIGLGADGIVYAGEKDRVERAVKLFFPESLKNNGIAAARERLELQLGSTPFPRTV